MTTDDALDVLGSLADTVADLLRDVALDYPRIPGSAWFAGLLDSHPRLLVAAIVTFLVLPRLDRTIRGRRTAKDPVRLFPPELKDAARVQAGGRCEMAGLLGRCRRPGEHADHWIPWSRGGASNAANLVLACAPHNLRKSARMPSRMATRGIARRRRRYAPAAARRRPGCRWSPV
jgi:hypothetical protein